jgi:hypothetical protein
VMVTVRPLQVAAAWVGAAPVSPTAATPQASIVVARSFRILMCSFGSLKLVT